MGLSCFPVDWGNKMERQGLGLVKTAFPDLCQLEMRITDFVRPGASSGTQKERASVIEMFVRNGHKCSRFAPNVTPAKLGKMT
jgi:hypothetical protein